jgi:predicted nuclease of predicted toxin-antitoxin system
MARYLADEDFPGPVVRALRAAGFDVARVQERALGEPDEIVLARAVAEERIPLTQDRGFGVRIIRDGAASIGVILLRLRGRTWTERETRAVGAITTLGERAVGAVTTITWTAIRTRAAL